MKSLIRWSVILGLVGSSVFGPAISQQMAAIALPESEVLKRMEGIPLFTVTNQEGVPVLATVPNPQDKNKQVQVATFFTSQQDAQTLVNNLKTKRPEIGKIAKVVPISLRQAYELAQQNKDNKENLVFQFLPAQQQVQSALTLLQQGGQKVEQFNGIPLFYAVGGQDKDKGFLTLEQGQTKVIPFYFNKQDLQTVLDQLKQQNPQLGATTKIEVTTLDQVISSMLQEDGPTVAQIQLVPAREALDFVLKEQQGVTPNPQAKPPQTAPAKPPAKK